MDTGATLSILGCRLLKQVKIWKTKTVAIRVGDGRTIRSLRGVDVTVCLGDEEMTQRCKVQDTDTLTLSLAQISCAVTPRSNCCLCYVPMTYTATLAVAFSLSLGSSHGPKECGLRYLKPVLWN